MEPGGPVSKTITDDDSMSPLNAVGFPVMSPPSHLAAYPGHHQVSSQGSPQQAQHLVTHGIRGLYTPSHPSSPYGESNPLHFYAADAQQGSPHALPQASSSGGLPSDSGSSSIVSSRRQARRLSEPACSDGNIFVVRKQVTHPYARLYSMKNGAERRRKMWNLSLEKMLFTPKEISYMGAPRRRKIYTASLEAHVEHLHNQLECYSLAPIPPDKLDSYRGLNAKTVKSMVSGLHYDGTQLKLKILKIDHANMDLEDQLGGHCK